MEEYYTVEAPGAEGYVVTFSEQTRTERNYDYVQLLSAEDSALTYGDKYSGGYNGSERFFPGLDGVPPLEVNAPRFRVLFKSDRSNQDYGFVLLAAIKLKAGGDEHGKRAAEIRDLNPAPLYLGQAPSYVCPDKSATGLLGNVVSVDRVLQQLLMTDCCETVDSGFAPPVSGSNQSCLVRLGFVRSSSCPPAGGVPEHPGRGQHPVAGLCLHGRPAHGGLRGLSLPGRGEPAG